MASYEMQGGLWRNKKKTSPKQPDFTGSVTIDGKEYYLAGWNNDAERQRNGWPAVKILVTDPDEYQQRKQQPQPQQQEQPPGNYAPPKDFDDDIPF